MTRTVALKIKRLLVEPLLRVPMSEDPKDDLFLASLETHEKAFKSYASFISSNVPAISTLRRLH